MMFKAHRKTIVWTVLIVVVISTYDVLLHALLAFGHIAFEWFELGLEELIEHVFHTTRHQSQIIVFYLLLCLALFGMYRLWRVLPRFYSYLQATRTHYMTHMSCYWRECSSVQKAKLITTCSAGVAGLCFWMFI
ncbi:MAG: hypothetical protein M8364_04050 [Methylobacter sp.]|uniref:hypothetical protein n=1 Tax=Methylobacter sp. TaxID=2051955 RepID=UPI00258FCE5E|nr:hypothetical protein [Methylobacter sp.]MCL7420059.1 hypothetical protein [Methylobacter sp.]